MALAKKRPNKMDRKEHAVAFLFILLPLIGFALFTVGSMIFSAYYSFFDFHVIKGTKTFIGFENYVALFKDRIISDNFKDSILNTLILLLSTPISMFLGLALAAVLKLGDVKGSKIFQSLYYLPAVSSAVAMNIIWRYIFHSDYGLINSIFNLDIKWLATGEASQVRLAIIIKNSIGGVGGPMIMYLAGMLNVPKDYYEAATIDGANRWKQFWSITFPLITPMTFYLLITGIIGGLQSYADADVFANGAPKARTIVYFIWERGIHASKYGLASAASLFLAFCIMVITVIQFRFSNRWVFED